MSDIVGKLREGFPCLEGGSDHTCRVKDVASGCLCATAADLITALRAENERLKDANAQLQEIVNGDTAEEERLRAENEKLRAALHEAADELDGYYRAEYPGDHPYSKRKLADAMRDNPARIALEETV